MVKMVSLKRGASIAEVHMGNTNQHQFDENLEQLIAPGKEIDRSLYPGALGLMANEHLFFPLDQQDWPVKIDSSRQLFVDDYLLAQTNAVKREVHQPSLHPANPLIIPDQPWEIRQDKGRQSVTFPFVHLDQTTGKWRMWYRGEGRYDLPSGERIPFPGLFAESEDGIVWDKPTLGLHAWKGSKQNNIVFHGGYIWGLFVEPEEQSERYRAMVKLEYGKRGGYYPYTSHDGLRWQRAQEYPHCVVFGGRAKGARTYPVGGVGDTSRFYFDEKLGKYIGDVKFVVPAAGGRRFRCRGMMESDDMVHWSRPYMTFYPDSLDDPDSQIYGHTGFCYQSMWLGFLRVMHSERDAGRKQTSVELTASRDGRHWTRVARGQEFMPLRTPEDWDGNYVDPTSEPILVGDELRCYYHGAWLGPEPTDDTPQCIGLATLQRDRFVSLNAADKPGWALTRPLTFNAGHLFINAQVADGGSITVEVLSADGQPLKGFYQSDCLAIRDDSTRIPVTWKRHSIIEPALGQPLSLRFSLTDAKLYAFWVESI